MPDALSNWQWLTSFPSRDNALVIDDAGRETARLLVRGFSRLQTVEPRSNAQCSRTVRESWRRLDEDSFDCVAVGDLNQLLSNDSRDGSFLFADIFRVLRKSGGVYVGIERIRPLGSGTHQRLFGGVLRSRQARLLEAAGFRNIREYYVIVSPLQPRHLVPARRSATVAWEQVMGAVGLAGTVRRLLARLGLHALLYRYRLVTARR